MIAAKTPSGSVTAGLAATNGSSKYNKTDELPRFRDPARIRELAAKLRQHHITDVRRPRTYQKLMADWSPEVLAWSEDKPVLLGVPTYDDAGVGYHEPNALLGIHRALSRHPLPANYQGIAIYSEWETTDAEWQQLREMFLRDSISP